MQSLQGHLLVATPSLIDPNFFQTVVLLIQHDDDGAFGVVLNRPTKSTVSDLWSKVYDAEAECDMPVFHGGPVSNTLLAVHTVPHLSDSDVIPGVYCSMDQEKIEQVVDEAGELFRFIVGSAGWAPGQLEGELEEGSWLVTPARNDDLWLDSNIMWEQVTKQIGESLVRRALGVQSMPDDPLLN